MSAKVVDDFCERAPLPRKLEAGTNSWAAEKSERWMSGKREVKAGEEGEGAAGERQWLRC